jgi:hypothetical protein
VLDGGRLGATTMSAGVPPRDDLVEMCMAYVHISTRATKPERSGGTRPLTCLS